MTLMTSMINHTESNTSPFHSRNGGVFFTVLSTIFLFYFTNGMS